MVGNSTQNSTNVLTDQLHSVVGFRNQVGVNLQYTPYRTLEMQCLRIHT